MWGLKKVDPSRMTMGIIEEHAAESNADFLIYTGNFCGYCVALKRLLDRKGLSYTEFNFDEHPDIRSRVVDETGHRTVPIVIDLRSENPTYVGGFNETNAMLR